MTIVSLLLFLLQSQSFFPSPAVFVWQPEPCSNEIPGARPCPPPADERFLILVLILGALVVVGLLTQNLIYADKMRRISRKGLRAAAGRISVALTLVSGLRGRELQQSCKLIASDLMTLLEGALRETSRYCYIEVPENEADWDSVFKTRGQVMAMRRRLILAMFLLNFQSQRGKGQRLTLEAVERYVSVLTPALKELTHDAAWQRQISFFEIDAPEWRR